MSIPAMKPTTIGVPVTVVGITIIDINGVCIPMHTLASNQDLIAYLERFLLELKQSTVVPTPSSAPVETGSMPVPVPGSAATDGGS